MKRCPACGRRLPLSEFVRNRSTRDGYGTYCRPCHNEIGRRNLSRRHGSIRHYHLKRRYGVGDSEVQALIDAQGGLCAICHERPAEHVDHDHETGAIRGILCFNCNGGLGQFRDRVDLLREAAAYLEQTPVLIPVEGPEQLVLGFGA